MPPSRLMRRGWLENQLRTTATPKGNTLELARRTRLGALAPFSLYPCGRPSEGFILDVLQNYTTFKVYFAAEEDRSRPSTITVLGLSSCRVPYADLWLSMPFTPRRRCISKSVL